MVYVPFTIFLKNQGLPLSETITPPRPVRSSLCWCRGGLADLADPSAAALPMLLPWQDLQQLDMPARTEDPGARLLAVELPPLHDPRIETALRLAIDVRAQAVVLPQVAGEADIQHLDIRLTVAEQESEATGRPSVSIIARPTDTPQGAAFARDFRGLSRRLTALLWDEAATGAALGLSAEDTAETHALLAQVRSQLLLSARAAGLAALTALPESPSVPFDDVEAVRTLCRNALRQGFTGVVAASRNQAMVIATLESKA